jgi:hypothetical protein
MLFAQLAPMSASGVQRNASISGRTRPKRSVNVLAQTSRPTSIRSLRTA